MDTVEQVGAGTVQATVAILVANAVWRRLLESACALLDLKPVVLNEREPDETALARFELLIADEALAKLLRARSLRARLSRPEGREEATLALIAVADANATLDGNAEGFEGVLRLPQGTAAIVAQLGLILYAHWASAPRYQTAVEELNLSRQMFRSATSGIAVSRADLPEMPLVYVNPAFEVMTGYTLEECLGRNCRFLQGADRDQPALTLIREAIAASRGVTAVVRNYRKDGTSFWNELTLSPIINRKGVATHFVGMQVDVTSRVEFEAALRESEKLAALGRLAASIAHEINNPLESVMNLLYLARETEECAGRDEYLRMADDELQRVASITSQSLRFYRQSTSPRAVLCHDLLEAVLDVYAARAASVSVAIEVRERMDGSIVCLESEIRQVLSNLVRNGLDAMEGKPGRLRLRSREATDWRTGRRGAVITVADTGSGIGSNAMEKLYTAFFTTKGISGTGLGLWVSAEIMMRHQGRVRVRSSVTPGKSWTVFQLFLPYQGAVVAL